MRFSRCFHLLSKKSGNNNVIPLNQAQIGCLTEKMMHAYHENGKVTA